MEQIELMMVGDEMFVECVCVCVRSLFFPIISFDNQLINPFWYFSIDAQCTQSSIMWGDMKGSEVKDVFECVAFIQTIDLQSIGRH